MRKIKYRAIRKSIPNGPFVYGDVLSYTPIGDPMISSRNEIQFKTSTPSFITCVPNTESEFIGLHDKAHKEIFDGDIVKDVIDDGDDIIVCYMQIFWNNDIAAFVYDSSASKDKSSYEFLTKEWCSEVLVVGNIHDGITYNDYTYKNCKC